MNYYVDYDPSVNPCTFTICEGKDCIHTDCARHWNHYKEQAFAKIHLECDKYEYQNVKNYS